MLSSLMGGRYNRVDLCAKPFLNRSDQTVFLDLFAVTGVPISQSP